MTLREHWIVLACIVRREMVRVNRIWLQTIIPPMITMSLYFVIFGKLVGSRIGRINGFSYIEFIVPGLIMMSIIINSYSNVSSSFFSSKFQRCIEELLVAPAKNELIILGYVLGGLYRGAVVGGVVLAVALFFTSLPLHSVGMLFAYGMLTASVFSLAGLLNALYANSFDDVSIIPTFVLTPLSYLGGVFYSLEQLPEFWAKVTLFNPVFYMVDGFRYAFLGSSESSVNLGLAILIASNIVLYVLTLTLFQRGIGLKN
mgnify:CR=1 FL=1